MIDEHFDLTQRETQVVRGIFEGYEHSEIALHIRRTIHTVDTHWRHAQVKLKVQGHERAIHLIWSFLHLMRMNAAIAPLEQTIVQLRRQVNELEGRGKEIQGQTHLSTEFS